jgi:hypothetical protein
MSPPLPSSAQWYMIGARGTTPPIKSNHMSLPHLDDDTLDAINALAEALVQHPEDVAPLMLYGHLPEHLMDIIEDYFSEEEDEA